ncbi:NADP-dependent oxidoreductase [Actinomadura parmotrematis]|uniref:NADP-dependent oxidoreductase n=1 Tax=Actinomadura parmotrematis TaxID=2864039 RepID=A0ABS7FMH9_9ACTN|nr:NADP-dependent oxidoreductase [Actinomadura parmotrematis]MBW8481592.1 NADP-dependent oxidoreductase [Actinomadura parmotrematis]
MRAIAVTEYGGTPSLMTVDKPAPGPGEVLVKIVAAGLNPFDWKVADGMLKDSVDAPFPLVMGIDGAGVVEEAGEGVTRLRAGEPVYGAFFGVAKGLGTYAEYTVVPADGAIAKMPDGMIYTQAAAVPTASMAALNAVRAAQVDEGRTVLVVGATGGVGQSAVQLAALQGAKVIATAEPAMAGRMRDLGAAETVDYTSGDLNDAVLAVHQDGIDAVLHFAGDAAAVQRTARLLRPGGAYVTTNFTANPDELAAQQIRGVNLNSETSGALLAELADLIDAGKLKIHVQQEVSLDEAPEAIARSRSGGARGKTVIRV